MSTPRTVLLKVFRYGLGDTAPRHDQFRVPAGPRTTVLDALLAVRRQQDPSLTVRHSRLHGSCGTCGMRVNGREVLACVTRLEEPGDPVVVEPLAGAAGRRPGRGHGACLPAARAGRPAAGPGQRARRHERRKRGSGSRAGGPGTLRGLHRVRPVPVGLPGRRGPPLPGPGRAGRRRAGPGEPTAQTRRWCSAWSTTLTAPGAATRRSNARPSARPGSTREAIMRLRGRLLRDRLPWLVGRYHRRSSHDPGHPPRPGDHNRDGRAGSIRAGGTWAPGRSWPTGSPGSGWSPTCTCTW